ncbi:HAD-like protein [Cucurbitaria berberidis CBS 394.84]|uniref:HAD-like protein n=1 Tax=Cucurbitaria berberidis CBS 394.84 TaxID=1168544 RepID=A0A9P4GKM0_9PLEO|nr:HAD-like protein [Cucurbitaria berberidis CBS 394.84]KAF1847169.1 HAD-like protein [Cucurbitaria berberidis CBS 394.84]
MSSKPRVKNIVFDVVGTLVSHEHFYTVIEDRLGPSLKKHSLPARLLGFAWLESAEREYTFLSLSGAYVPFAQVFEAMFFRVLHFAGVPEPRSVANEEDVKYFMQEYKKCEVRPGAKLCIDTLKREGWTVWAFTSGDRERVVGYFEQGGVSIDAESVVTCDEIGVGKPELRAYAKLKEQIGVGEGDEVWFAAAHGWDVSAAGRAGFKTAYCTVLEREPLEDVFGKMDVVADSLEGLAEKVMSAEAKACS